MIVCLSDRLFKLSENRLLGALSPEEYERLLPWMEVISLNLKEILYQPRELIEFVYFPINSVISLLTITLDGTQTEAGIVGNEGMLGLPVFLGTGESPCRTMVQVPGDALRMKAEVFKREVTPTSRLYNLLQGYTQALLVQTAQTIACNRLHSISQRFCRWLLRCQDAVGSGELYLTQEILATTLGVRRASVSEVASNIQKAGLIRYTRGRIEILDSAGLEAASCECYCVFKQDYERLLLLSYKP